jgi:hypothetical protein
MSEPKSSSILPGAPAWDPRDKRFQTRLVLGIIITLVLILTGAVFVWVIVAPPPTAQVARTLSAGADLTIVLAPVLAAAAGIERFLETIFGIIEGSWRTLVAYLGRGFRWLKSAETEVTNAREWLAKASDEYNRQLQTLPQFAATGQVTAQTLFDDAKAKLDEAKKIMSLAEQRLRTAEDQLGQVTDSDNYKNAKRAAAIYLGLLLGLIVATASSLQMFAMMGIALPHPKIDVVITGLVIGSGSAPVHSLINILQSAKDTLDSAQGWIESAGLKNRTTAQRQQQNNS